MGPERAQRRRVATLNLITIRREAAKNFSNTFRQTTMRRYQCRRLPRASLAFGPFPVMSVVVDASAKFRYFWCLLFTDRAGPGPSEGQHKRCRLRERTEARRSVLATRLPNPHQPERVQSASGVSAARGLGQPYHERLCARCRVSDAYRANEGNRIC